MRRSACYRGQRSCIAGLLWRKVSIAYDLSDEAEFVENRILRLVEQAVCNRVARKSS